MPKIFHATQLLLIAGSLIGLSFVRSATAETTATAPLAATLTTEIRDAEIRELRSGDLNRELGLQIKVGFEAKRILIGELLTDLQKQSGVKLMIDAGTPLAKVRVTAFVKEMPLATAMSSLARLYGATWTQLADGPYTLRQADPHGLEVKLAPLLNSTGSGDYQQMLKERQHRRSMFDEILPYADMENLKSQAGVPVSTLPPALQLKVRKELEKSAALDLLTLYQQASEPFIESYTLAIIPAPQDTRLKNSPNALLPQAIVRLPNGSGFNLGILRAKHPEDAIKESIEQDEAQAR